MNKLKRLKISKKRGGKRLKISKQRGGKRLKISKQRGGSKPLKVNKGDSISFIKDINDDYIICDHETYNGYKITNFNKLFSGSVQNLKKKLTLILVQKYFVEFDEYVKTHEYKLKMAEELELDIGLCDSTLNRPCISIYPYYSIKGGHIQDELFEELLEALIIKKDSTRTKEQLRTWFKEKKYEVSALQEKDRVTKEAIKRAIKTKIYDIRPCSTTTNCTSTLVEGVLGEIFRKYRIHTSTSTYSSSADVLINFINQFIRFLGDLPNNKNKIIDKLNNEPYLNIKYDINHNGSMFKYNINTDENPLRQYAFEKVDENEKENEKEELEKTLNYINDEIQYINTLSPNLETLETLKNAEADLKEAVDTWNHDSTNTALSYTPVLQLNTDEIPEEEESIDSDSALF